MTDEPILRATLRIEEQRALIEAVGLEIGELSPLAERQSGAELPNDTAVVLKELGWFDDSDPPALNPLGRAAIEMLAAPKTRVGLVVGSPDGYSATTSLGLGSLEGEEAVLSVAEDEDRIHLLFPQPAGRLSEVLTDHFGAFLVPTAPPFDATLSIPAYLTLMCVLDRRMQVQFEALIDREYRLFDDFTIDDLWEMLLEGRTGGHLAWQVTTTAMAWPEIDLASLDRDGLAEGVTQLEELGLLSRLETGRLTVADPLDTVAEGLVPVVRFGAVRVQRRDPSGRPAPVQFAVRHGFGAILLERPARAGDVAGLRVTSVTSTDLTHLILNFRFPLRACPGCGEANAPEAQFCPACGRQLASPPASEDVPPPPPPPPPREA